MENQYNYYNPDDKQFQNNYSQGEPNHQKNPKKNNKKVIAVIGLAIIFGIVSSGVFLSTSYIGTNILGLNKNSNSDVKATTTAVTKSSSVVTSDVSSIVNDVMPSVVAITNMSVQEVQNFWGQTSQYQSESCGTGIIIAKNR